MKKNKSKNISSTLIKSSIIVFSLLILLMTFIVIVSVIAFETGTLITEGVTIKNRLWIYLLFLLAMFIIVCFVIYIKDKKTINIIRKLEDATEKVANGDFKFQIELTDDENINTYIINFNKMVKELNNKETLQEDFISNVSHEFKTPLSVIQSYSKALRRPNIAPETKAEYEKILDMNIKKLSNLTSNILNLAKLENQEIILEKSNFLIDEQIRQCIVSFEPEWSKKNIEFDFELPETKYYGAENLISQIWQNIIGNAIKFTNENGLITVKLKENEAEVITTISDNGVGMDETTIKKIFDKFYQGDTSHASAGNGLGLALVSRILKICDGEIEVTSELNKGSTFIIKLKK